MKSVGFVFLVIFGTVFSEEICSSNDEIRDRCMNPCQPTCAQPTPLFSSPVCQIKMCVDGCVCKPHLLRDTESGRCVRPSDCSEAPTCEGENEEFNSCASFCPRTCQSFCKNSTRCISACDERCDCKFGYIRDEISGKCVEPSNCAKCKCRENELWTQCVLDCQETCYSLKHPQNCFPIDATCFPGCICTRGYVRNEKTGMCVRINQCPR